MNKNFVFLFICLFSIQSLSFAAPEKKVDIPKGMGFPKIITLNSRASINVIPDSAIFTVGVQTDSKKIKEAQKTNNQKIMAVKDILNKYQIKKTDIKTTNFSIRPIYNYKDGESIWKGYSVNNTWSVKVSNLDDLANIIDDLAEHSTFITNLCFTFASKDKAKKEAFELALKDAKKQAESIAKQLGYTLGDASFVEVNTSDFMGSGMEGATFTKLANSATAPILERGSLEITANIKVSYQLNKSKN